MYFIAGYSITRYDKQFVLGVVQFYKKRFVKYIQRYYEEVVVIFANN